MSDWADKRALRIALEWWDMGHITDEKLQSWLTEPHLGDCIKQPQACNRCFAEDVKSDADMLAGVLRSARLEVKP